MNNDNTTRSAEEIVRRVFVYGTLRTGYGNHGLVANLVATAAPATALGYELRGQGNAFPYALPVAGEEPLIGELLEFSQQDWPEALRLMDQLEGHPDFYTRQLIVSLAADGTGRLSWIYVDANRISEDLQPVVGNDWANSDRAMGRR